MTNNYRASVRKVIHCYTKQDGLCAYCECEITHENVTVDHIIPQSFGGEKTKRRNIVLACKRCNAAKCKVETKVSDDLSTIEKVESLLQKLERKIEIRERRMGKSGDQIYKNMVRIVGGALELYRLRTPHDGMFEDDKEKKFKIPPFMNSLDFDSNA